MFETLFGAEMPLAMRFFIAFIVVLALIGAFFWLMRRFGAERLGSGSNRSRQPRLAVIDAAPVDGRRRLVLIRRDNVEHLLMIGGPTDIVVEASIVRAASVPREMPAPRAAAAAIDTLPRPVPLGESGSWPLQPEPASPRPNRMPEEPAQRADADVPPPPPPEAPVRREPTSRQARAVENSLASLAAELTGRPAPSSDITAVRAPVVDRMPTGERPAERPPTAERAHGAERSAASERPAPPERALAAERPHAPERPATAEHPAPPPSTSEPAPPSADENLAEMAQRLEAALRKPVAAESRAPGRVRLAGDPPAEEGEESRAKPKSLYESLEQEMASLLGRPAGKS